MLRRIGFRDINYWIWRTFDDNTESPTQEGSSLVSIEAIENRRQVLSRMDPWLETYLEFTSPIDSYSLSFRFGATSILPGAVTCFEILAQSSSYRGFGCGGFRRSMLEHEDDVTAGMMGDLIHDI